MKMDVYRQAHTLRNHRLTCVLYIQVGRFLDCEIQVPASCIIYPSHHHFKLSFFKESAYCSVISF